MSRLLSRSRRPAFTLIELLVVIAIIGILASLLLAALFKARNVVEEVQNRNDISELDKAVYAFATSPDLGAPGFFPSYIDLPQKLTSSNSSNPDVAFMLRCFPKCADNWAAGSIDWSGVGAGATGKLQGQQCLVYFLAGPGGKGWAKNAANPCDTPANCPPRIGPFYEFKANRLTGGAAAYQDVFKTPFAYFNTSSPSADPGGLAADCAALGVQPYVDATGKPFNPNSFQIISAGRNGAFGPGGSVALPYPPTSAGGDDFTNFWPTRLGAK